LKDADTYQQWYATEHPVPQLLEDAVYGLTEIFRDEISNTTLVANPGCYPTSVLLALYPMLKTYPLLDTVIVDAKSGVSGAGRKPKLITHFVEVADNLSPYNIGRIHRHLPEMEQVLGWWTHTPPSLIFSPHLIPTARGLLSTIYIKANPDWDEDALFELYRETYASEPFVQVLGPGENATYAHVNRTNRCAIGLHLVGDTLILTSAIDNLLKGASGQAIQNMNLMFGFKETEGLI
jgi:N-acetyl-gamma-glutamyl-phosphate reductase